MRIRRILAVIDSESNLPTLDAAFSIAEKFDAELTVLQVIEDPLVEAEKSVYPLGEDDQIQLARTEKKLKKLIGGVSSARKIAKEIGTLVVRGKTAKVVERQTTRLDIDLLVVGHRPEWRIEHFLSGRKLDRIVNRSSCLLLIVPEPDENRYDGTAK
jgi:nucleotide-binding universal stress UspA family protein